MGSRRQRGFLVIGVLLLAGWADRRAPLPPLNQAILDFARSQLGKSVGDGQCTSLATEAIAQAGARRFPYERSGDYVWGEPVASFAEALPGDLLQFRDAVLEGRRRLPDGRVLTYRHQYPHHTAILGEVAQGGRVVSILHQNIATTGEPPDQKQLVKATTIYPRSLKKGGRIWIYRPVDRDPGVTPDPPERSSPGSDRP